MTKKENFITTCRLLIKRDGIEELLATLEKTDFYTAPASTRFHDSEEGGLVAHSLRVFDFLYGELMDNENFNHESIAIVSLFHDLCKIGYYKIDYRNVKNEFGKWDRVPYYTVEDKLPYGHGEKSVDMLRDFMKLTEEEKFAIRFHMGSYEGQQIWNTLSEAYKMYPLALYTHIADMKATYLK